jgi:hypothetical protein
MTRKGRDPAELPPVPIQNVVLDVIDGARQLEKAFSNFRFDVDVVSDVMVNGEAAHPPWKHTSMGAALGRHGGFSEYDACVYMAARLGRIKKRIGKLLTALTRQMREYESQGIRPIRARDQLDRLTEENAAEWR